jgi:thiamine biosynthesis lipoprotein
MMFFNQNLRQIVTLRSSLWLLLFYFTGCLQDSIQLQWSGQTMGTSYQIKLTHQHLTQSQIDELKQKVDATLIEVNRQMSTYDPQSEISRFNDFLDTVAFPVSEEFAMVVQTAIDISWKSGKTFDITVGPLVNLWGFGKKSSRFSPPGNTEIKSLMDRIGIENLRTVGGNSLKKKIPLLNIDLNAIAPGYGVDAVAAQLEKAGLSNFMVEIGGEVIARGLNASDEAWKIGIDSPGLASLPGEDIRVILALQDMAVATSGDYRNYFEFKGQIYSHTIDPSTGKPVTHDLASATVVTKNCMEADAYATALMVMGKEKGMAFIETVKETEALFITRRGKNSYDVFQSSGFKKYVSE